MKLPNIILHALICVLTLHATFAISATAQTQNELQILVKKANSSCPKNITSSIFFNRDSYGLQATLKKVSCKIPLIQFDIYTSSNISDWENDVYAKLDGIKDGLLVFYIRDNRDLFELIESLSCNVEFCLKWNNSTDSKYQFTNLELSNVLFGHKRRFLLEQLNTHWKRLLPMDISKDFNAMIATGAQHQFNAILESIHPNGKYIEWVMRFSNVDKVINEQLKTYFSRDKFDIRLFCSYNIISQGYDTRDFYNLIVESGYGTKSTMVLGPYDVISYELSHRQLKELMDSIVEMDNKDKLAVLYKYIYAKIPLPISDQNESLVSIDYNNQYWIERREVSPELYELIAVNTAFKDAYITNLCSTNQILFPYLSMVSCGYKTIFVNRDTKQEFIISYSASDIENKVDELYEE